MCQILESATHFKDSGIDNTFLSLNSGRFWNMDNSELLTLCCNGHVWTSLSRILSKKHALGFVLDLNSHCATALVLGGEA